MYFKLTPLQINASKFHHEPSFEESNSACERLHIKPQTLYAYVSRGLVNCKPHPLDSRKRVYSSRDIERLLTKKNQGQSRHAIASSTIDFGEPILRSDISSINDGQLFYHGHSAIELSKTATLEDIFELLCKTKIKDRWLNDSLPLRSTNRKPYARFVDSLASSVRKEYRYGNKRHAFNLLRLMALNGAKANAVITGSNDSSQNFIPIHQLLAQSWTHDERAPDLIRRALVLSADHELNASTYATRITASAGATLAACLLTGISTLSGIHHGGLTDRCLAWMRTHTKHNTHDIDILENNSAPGFGHRLYPEGDPRPVEILRHCPAPKAWMNVVTKITNTNNERPTLDFGLATLEHQLKLPRGAGFAIFAIGRTVGWLAHSFEQRDTGALIRPRAWSK